jgi:cytidine deaminase
MKKFEKTVRVEVLKLEELSQTEKTLIGLACNVRLNAQAPYSHYQVGCALITSDTTVSVGCNVERVSWTQTDHAEQVAISSAIARIGICRISGMAIVGGSEGQEVVWPPAKISKRNHPLIKSVSDVCLSCGQCLQIIAENCFDENGKFDPTIPLLGYDGGEIYRTTIGDAYPMPFLPQHLGVNYSQDPRLKKK